MCETESSHCKINTIQTSKPVDALTTLKLTSNFHSCFRLCLPLSSWLTLSQKPDTLIVHQVLATALPLVVVEVEDTAVEEVDTAAEVVADTAAVEVVVTAAAEVVVALAAEVVSVLLVSEEVVDSEVAADLEVVLEEAAVSEEVADSVVASEEVLQSSRNTCTSMSHPQSQRPSPHKDPLDQLPLPRNTTRLSSSRPPPHPPQLPQSSQLCPKTPRRPSSTFLSRNPRKPHKSASPLLPLPLHPNQKFTSSDTRPRRKLVALEVSEVLVDSVQEAVLVDSAQVVVLEVSPLVVEVSVDLWVVALTLAHLAPEECPLATVPLQLPAEDHTKSFSVYEIKSAIDPASKAEPMVLLLSFWANISPALYYRLYHNSVLGLVYFVFFSNQKTRWQ